MRKVLPLVTAMAMSIGVAGCNTSTSDGNDTVDLNPINSGDPTREADIAVPVFNVARQELPLANDFLFSGSTDGTLVFPAGDVPLLLADGSRNPDYNPVFDALNDLDGFSTTGQLFIPFSKALSPITDPRSAFLVPLNYADVTDLTSLDLENPFDLAAFASTSIAAEVVSYADGNFSDNVLRISPLTPLESRTRYLVILTNKILDEDGKATQLDGQFDYLISDEALLNPALAPARTAMQGWYSLAQAFVSSPSIALSADDVTLAYTMTTGSRNEVLSAIAAPGAINPQLSTTAGDVSIIGQKAINDLVDAADDKSAGEAAAVGFLTNNGTSLEDAQSLIGLMRLPTPSPRMVTISEDNAVPIASVLGQGTHNFVTGRIKLPLYSAAPQGAYSDDGVVLNPAANDNYICQVNDLQCAQSQGTAANTVIGQWQSDENVLFNLTGDEATKAPSDNITGLFPFPEEQGIVDVPVTITLPDEGNGCAKPWKSVIYQHGITSNRFSTLVLADQLAAAPSCFATIAIDLPLHGLTTTDLNADGTQPLLLLSQASEGVTVDTSTEEAAAAAVAAAATQERHFGLTADGILPTAMTAESGDSGSLYITFLRFQATRDNNRQAVMDLLNLASSIPYIDLDGDLADADRGIATTENNTTADEYAAFASLDPATRAVVFGPTANLDFNPDEVYFVGVSLGSIIGTQFVALNNTARGVNTGTSESPVIEGNTVGNNALPRIQKAVFAVPGGALPKLLENSNAFAPQIVGGLTSPDGFNLTQGGDLYESLLYTYQAAVDSADPISFGPLLKASQTPYTLIQAIGDNVVPNNAPNAPLAGTDPLVRVFEAEQIDASSDLSTVSTQNYFRLLDDFSSHSSVAAPDDTPEGPGTFALTTQYILSLFGGAPTLAGGDSIVEPVATEQ